MLKGLFFPSKDEFKKRTRQLEMLADKNMYFLRVVLLFCLCSAISRARIVLFVVEWRREVHTSTQPEWICVQHGLVLSHELIGIAVVSGRSICRWIVSRHGVRARGHRLWREARDIRGIY